MSLPDKSRLADAAALINRFIHRTTVMSANSFNKTYGVQAFFKCENFQRMGAFKMRGASHAIASLTEEQRRAGVVTHSSGNFAQAVALAAKLHGIRATVVMPDNAPVVKTEAVRGYGAEIIFSGPSPQSREEKVAAIMANSDMPFIHPSNDLMVILGNSTATKELVEDIPDLEVVIAPVGGGGLIAGTALAAHAFGPGIEVWGAEPENVDDAYRSLKSGQIEYNTSADTIADGLRTHLGDINFPIIRQLVSGIFLVSEAEILDAMWWVWQRMKIIIEPSSAVAVAAVVRYRQQLAGKRIGIILSGGNADIRHLATIS